MLHYPHHAHVIVSAINTLHHSIDMFMTIS